MDDVALSYRLTGSGWSSATFRVGTKSAMVTAGYLTDALGDLVRSALALAHGAQSLEVVWDPEGGQYIWFLRREDEVVHIRIAWDDQWVAGESGKTILAATCEVRAFSAAIAKSASEVLSTHGVDGYLAEWAEHAFPLDALEALTATLSSPEA